MFALHAIILNNFRAYRGEVRFAFPSKPGLYFFTGENNLAPGLGANAVGKSTLLDGVTWVLFGRTTRGLKANEVISWGAAHCNGTLVLTVGGRRMSVHRSQKPNTLSIDGVPVDQIELESVIRLNHESFLNTVIKSQFGESFLALSPANKLTLFSDILNLDFWLKKSEAAADAYSNLIFEVETLTKSVETRIGKIANLSETIAEYEEASKTFTRNMKIKIKEKKIELNRATSLSVSADDKIAEILAAGRKRIEQLDKRLDVQLDALNRAVRDRTKVLDEIEKAKRSIAEYKTLSKECPTCHQPVETSYVMPRIKACEIIKQTSEIRLDAVEADIAMYKKHIVETKGKIASTHSEITDAKTKEAEARVLQNKVARLEGELLALRDAEDPYCEYIKSNKDRIELLTVMAGEDKKTLATASAECTATGYWPKGFKQIRLFIIEQAFRTLELEVNNSLAQLGLPDWQITFDVERENKSGGVTKGFVVFVKSPANSESVRWENWSGGETQRLQLAGDSGLANLIMRQNGLRNTIEFYDEPSTHLSPEGMMDLADTLHERAISEGKCIWIVDHSSITNFGDFQGIITARKDSNGSTVTYRNN